MILPFAPGWLPTRTPVPPTIRRLAQGVRCDDAGCAVQMGDGRYAAIAKRADAFADDCEKARRDRHSASAAAWLQGDDFQRGAPA